MSHITFLCYDCEGIEYTGILCANGTLDLAGEMAACPVLTFGLRIAHGLLIT
jgi:hypothetical protein